MSSDGLLPSPIARVFDGEHAREVARDFDITRLTPDFLDDPFPYYRALREHAPVKRMRENEVILTRHADIEAVYKDTRTFASDKKVEFLPKYGQSPLYEHHTTSLVFNDPPLHTRVRRIIAGALTPRAIASMEPALVELIESLIERAAELGEIDLIEDFASAIPIEVIGNLLGVPHADRGPLRGWSLAILGALEPVLTPEQEALGNRSVEEMLAYLKELVDDRRRNLQDPDRDVLSRLIIGEQGTGEQLSEKELLHNCIFLLNAGHETTTNLIGNGIVSLMQWPDEKARLIADTSLIATAVEEFLRFESSNQLGNRITTCSCEIGGEKLAEGKRVHIAIGGANRDPERFPDPDRLDITRQPNRHLAFASGPHQCVGMALARLEGRIAIGRFLGRFPNVAPSGKAVRGGRARFRGFLSVPVTVG